MLSLIPMKVRSFGVIFGVYVKSIIGVRNG